MGTEIGGYAIRQSYLGGLIRGTAYGPEHYVPPELKRFRVKNCEEYIKYIKKVEESQGFDVDGCTGALAGGISSLHHTSSEWNCANWCAKFAASKQEEMQGIPIDFDLLAKVNIQPVGGIMYYVIFTAFVTVDTIRQLKLYRAKVWARVDKPITLHLLLFEEFLDSKIPAIEMRKHAALILQEVEELERCRSSEHIVDVGRRVDGRSRAVHIRPKPGQLHSMGFSFLLKDFKSQNPGWRYARVRRAASKKWRSFYLGDKLPYIIRAEEKFREMHGF